GKGTVWFTDPQLDELPPTPTEPVTYTTPVVVFRTKRELGGLTVHWKKRPRGPWRVYIDTVPHTPETESFVWLPETEAESVTVESDGVVAALTIEPPSWAPTANDFWSIVAKAARRGDYPRYLLGEQAYW